MAIILPFEIEEGNYGPTISSGTFIIEGDYIAPTLGNGYSSEPIISISGTYNGEAITGLSDFASPNNTATVVGGIFTTIFFGPDAQGISFSAGGVDYHVSQHPDQAGENYGEKVVVTDSNGGSPITAQFIAIPSGPECFTSGARILTTRGNIPVEDLRIGDIAITASGRERPITWIGSRTVANPGFEGSPVRIRAGAFAVNVPARDLYLSPGHPVLIGADEDGEGGHLVPIMCLINGTTIERMPVESVTYWHVELDEHDILLAEGLPAESYYDMGSRAWFEGNDGPLADPDFVPPGESGRCRPVAIDGPVVEAERRRLDGVFAAYLDAQCDWRDGAMAG